MQKRRNETVFLFQKGQQEMFAIDFLVRTVLGQCLRLLKSAEDLDVVRDCLTHGDWRVRVQAASALGRIGVAEDEERLTPLLSDKEWWVRYRAAQALSRLPSVPASKLKSLREKQSEIIG